MCFKGRLPIRAGSLWRHKCPRCRGCAGAAGRAKAELPRPDPNFPGCGAAAASTQLPRRPWQHAEGLLGRRTAPGTRPQTRVQSSARGAEGRPPPPGTPNGREMALPDSVTTCLSQPVHYAICKLGFEKKDTYDIDNILSGSGEVCWPAVTEHVCYLESDRSVDYIKSIRSLGPVCESVNSYFKSLTKKQFVIHYASWFHWTNCTEVFLKVFDVLQSTQATEVALGLMKLTSCLERALGDVYLLKGNDCPFLLRDLLASEQLADVFGQAVMNVLRVFIGSPHGLNLRNVLWHGFASPQEIPAKYCAMLLFLTAGLGQLLQTYLLQTKSVLVHQPYVIFISLEELDAFPDLNSEILSIAEELVKLSGFVLKIMLPFWIAALTAFKQSRYADSVILLLPQLEAGLRLLFTTTNKCPNRLLTAESSALYTTFDEMLAKHLDNEEVNQLPVVLEEPAMDFLWDFLNHQEGPRIRDHLSHGEINLETFPREIANQIVGFAITILCRFSDEAMYSLKEHMLIKPLMNCASCYQSRFHPISRLKKQVLECMKSIHLWPELATVPEEQEQRIKGLEGNAEANTLILMISEIISQLQHYMPQNCCSSDDPINSVLTERLLVELCDTRICTLYSPRPVLEVVVILRKISAQCHQVSQQVIAGAALRHTQWLNKTLRSRQRHNYRRMLNSIKFLSPVLRLVLLLITLELVSVHSVCKKNPFDYQQYLKFLKSVLQYTENLVTYTSPDKNKWDETMELTKKTLIKIQKISDRKLMLMHLAT
ncbi:endoplasmic reticulum membrane-associated RNA degradation protein isoform X2 [Zonotrichia albicollis]|uniref:endoplasmic reticulum membrane-associated RNA degradation protein isoform X2 n=1 Tax=Zonotrichia albicollis TaxID=44394 RepID=UPI003D80D90C